MGLDITGSVEARCMVGNENLRDNWPHFYKERATFRKIANPQLWPLVVRGIFRIMVPDIGRIMGIGFLKAIT